MSPDWVVTILRNTAFFARPWANLISTEDAGIGARSSVTHAAFGADQTPDRRRSAYAPDGGERQA